MLQDELDEGMSIPERAKVLFDASGIPSKDYSFEYSRSSLGDLDNAFADDISYWKNMSDSERKAMEKYTGGSYDPIGVGLRTEVDIDPKYAEYAHTLSSQLESRPGLTERTVIYRGLEDLYFVDDSF